MQVRSIAYKPIEGGALGGHFALHVTLGGGNSASVFSPPALAEKLHSALSGLNIKAKIKSILIDYREASEPIEEMLSLLGLLKDWGLYVVLWVDQDVRYPWFEYASYIVAFVMTPHWPNFRVSEIRYVLPEDVASWTEPEVFEGNDKASCYIESWAKGAEVLRFITECSRPWGLIRPSGVAISFKLKE